MSADSNLLNISCLLPKLGLFRDFTSHRAG